MIQLNSLSPWIVNDNSVSMIGTFRTRDDWFKSAKRTITDVELAMSGRADPKSVGIDASLQFRSRKAMYRQLLRLVGSGHLRTVAALRSHAPKQLILLWEMR